MSDDKNFAEVKVKKGSRISAVWIIPIVAILIGAFLVYKSYTERGINITISYKTGEGIEADKTKVKYEGVEVGQVKAVNLNRKDDNVIVSVELRKEAASFAKKGSIFWVVKPRISTGAISGLETLVSGSYIKVRPGHGETTKHFTGLEEPPVGDPSLPGLHITMEADELGSLQVGSPIYFRKIKVGELHGHSFSDDKKGVLVHAYIEKEYAPLVTENTMFWDASGISVEAGLSGVKMRTESLTALLDGGITFDTPGLGVNDKPVENGTVFKLYQDRENAMSHGGLKIIIEAKELGSLKERTPVLFRQLKVGEIHGHELTPDNKNVYVHVYIYPKYSSLVRENTKFWNVTGFSIDAGLSGIKFHSESIETLLEGGIAFDMPEGEIGPPAAQGTFFTLYDNLESTKPKSGLKIALEVKELGSLKQGTPVLFRDIQVGEIEGHRLKKDNTGVHVDLFIYGKYASLVREDSRFWNVGGITVDASLSSGVKIRTESLETILEGGIAFETPFGNIGEPAKNGAIFTLYDSYESATEKGISITITFKSAEGLSGGSSIKYKGMDVGKVKNIKLSESLDHVDVEALLDPSAASLAKEGTKFWVARPEIGLSGVSNLGAIISNYIEVQPGDGSPTNTFVGLEEAPLETNDKSNLKIVLLSDKLGSVSVGAPIYYRQVQVGKVIGHKLADTANDVEIHLSIDEKYAPLVRQNTKFWNVSGIGVDLYLFGVKAKTESLTSLIKGGIAFATPLNEKMGSEVENGMVFQLYDQPEKEWLAWAPVIQLSEDKIVEMDPYNDKTTKIDTTQNQVKSSTKRNRTSSKEKHYGLSVISGRTY